jgi:hypothetical protein
MAGLVAVRVLANQAGDVGLLTAGGLAFGSEQLVKLAREGWLASH